VKPFFSVIMLTYNRENLMPLMAESVLAQDFTDFEFIIVDNGSSDKSGDLAEEFAERDSRVKVIHTPRGNIGSGRNAGLNAANGEYIAFVDDDDTLTNDYLSFHKALIDKHNADISICGTSDRTYDELKIMTAEEALITLFERKYYIVGAPAKAIKADLFSGKLFSETHSADDIKLVPEIISDAKTVAYCGMPKYIYNRHENGNSAWATNHALITPEILREYLSVYTERTIYLCDKFPENAAAWKYFQWSFMISMVDKVERYKLEKCETERAEMIAELREIKDEFLHSAFITENERILINMI
jgi:glycosyltransferase involved in cell wall biosynthesis